MINGVFDEFWKITHLSFITGLVPWFYSLSPSDASYMRQ